MEKQTKEKVDCCILIKSNTMVAIAFINHVPTGSVTF
jgi:hypothetical protein